MASITFTAFNSIQCSSNKYSRRFRTKRPRNSKSIHQFDNNNHNNHNNHNKSIDDSYHEYKEIEREMFKIVKKVPVARSTCADEHNTSSRNTYNATRLNQDAHWYEMVTPFTFPVAHIWSIQISNHDALKQIQDLEDAQVEKHVREFKHTFPPQKTILLKDVKDVKDVKESSIYTSEYFSNLYREEMKDVREKKGTCQYLVVFEDQEDANATMDAMRYFYNMSQGFVYPNTYDEMIYMFEYIYKSENNYVDMEKREKQKLEKQEKLREEAHSEFLKASIDDHDENPDYAAYADYADYDTECEVSAVKPMKADGTPDMRFRVNKQPVAPLSADSVDSVDSVDNVDSTSADHTLNISNCSFVTTRDWALSRGIGVITIGKIHRYEGTGKSYVVPLTITPPTSIVSEELENAFKEDFEWQL